MIALNLYTKYDTDHVKFPYVQTHTNIYILI